MPPIIDPTYASAHPRAAARIQLSYLLDRIRICGRVMPADKAARWLQSRGYLYCASLSHLTDLCKNDVFPSADLRYLPRPGESFPSHHRWYLDANEALAYIRLPERIRRQVRSGTLDLHMAAESCGVPLDGSKPEQSEGVVSPNSDLNPDLNPDLDLGPSDLPDPWVGAAQAQALTGFGRMFLAHLALRSTITAEQRYIQTRCGRRLSWCFRLAELNVYLSLTRSERVLLGRRQLSLTDLYAEEVEAEQRRLISTPYSDM